MPARKSLTADNLKALGARRLADLLIEVSQSDPRLKRRLRYELAGEAGAGAIATDIRKRLISLGRARSFIDWQKRSAFVKEIDLLRKMILAKLAGPHPDLALDLLWQFMASAGTAMERVDDSNGDLLNVFREACNDLAAVAAKVPPDPIRLAGQVFSAVNTNDYGEYDTLIPVIFPTLGPIGAQNLTQQLTEALQHTVAKDPYGIHAGTLKRVLQDIADQQDDVDAFIAQESEASQKVPLIAAAIGRRLLQAGRNTEALEILQAAPRQETPSIEDLDEDLLYTRADVGPDDWGDVWVEALLANHRPNEAQAFRWSRFERGLHPASLRGYLKALPDFEDVEAEERAIRHVAAFPHLPTALQFLIDWPDHHQAASLVLQRRGELDGNLYYILDPAAKALEAKHPLAATILYRTMIEYTLEKSKTTRYGHATRHLLECQSLISIIEDYGDIETHETFVARIRAGHARKSAFWSRVEELMAFPG